MRINELITMVSKETGINKKDVKLIIESMTTCIGNSLIDGEDVQLYRFGNFKIKDVKGRKICNVSTKKLSYSKDFKKIVFEPSTELKKAIQS